MRSLSRAIWIIGALAMTVPSATPKPRPAAGAEDDRVVVIVFKDGHRQSFRLEEIARIEFNAPAGATFPAGQARFQGVWKVGVGGDTSGTFLITLKPGGVAEKTISDPHGGRWTVVNGEARVSWEDGWTDVIRKVGGRWQKAAYSPGASLDGEPTNVAEATYTEPN